MKYWLKICLSLLAFAICFFAIMVLDSYQRVYVQGRYEHKLGQDAAFQVELFFAGILSILASVSYLPGLLLSKDHVEDHALLGLTFIAVLSAFTTGLSVITISAEKHSEFTPLILPILFLLPSTFAHGAIRMRVIWFINSSSSKVAH